MGNLYSDNPGSSGPGSYPAYSNPIALGASPANPPGIPFFGWNGGGSATVQYDSCWVLAVTQSLPYHLVAQRELSYLGGKNSSAEEPPPPVLTNIGATG